jgi:hypothetical protein
MGELKLLEVLFGKSLKIHLATPLFTLKIKKMNLEKLPKLSFRKYKKREEI